MAEFQTKKGNLFDSRHNLISGPAHEVPHLKYPSSWKIHPDNKRYIPS
jgi:hypothetical protein